MNDLNGKIGVVTGASRGLGRRIAVRLAQKGVAIALLARSEGAIEKVREEIAVLGGRALAVPVARLSLWSEPRT